MRLDDYFEPFRSAVLGTLSDNGYPFSSYAPFVYDGKRAYIFISDITTHAQNITVRPKASLLFIEDESETENIFARKRISLQCNTEKISRESSEFGPLLEIFKEKTDAEMVELLMQMQDFNLYALTPIYGEATFGFGKAYHLGGESMNELIPRKGMGHNKKV